MLGDELACLATRAGADACGIVSLSADLWRLKVMSRKSTWRRTVNRLVQLVVLTAFLLMIQSDNALASPQPSDLKVWGLMVPSMLSLVVIPAVSVVAWLKGRKLAVAVGAVGWICAATAAFARVNVIEPDHGSEPFSSPLVNEYPMLATFLYLVAVAGMLSVLYFSFRLAKPSSWWSQHRYDSNKLDRDQ